MRVEVKPELLRWACERAGFAPDTCVVRFPQLQAWTTGSAKPTLKQLEKFARATYAPVGYLFLDRPPDEPVPVPDFRADPTRRGTRPSANLLDTIYLCQQRQEWYREFASTTAEAKLPFVGSATVRDSVVAVAAAIRRALRFDLDARARLATWSEGLRLFCDQADAAGIMVMCSSVVGSNSHRKLERTEFGGFAMPDELAPLVFVNGDDTRARQMFTLAHELAHVWLGQSALSDPDVRIAPDDEIEGWCNRVAAELLVPLDAMRAEYRPRADLATELARLAKHFKVSTLVVLRRMHDVGGLARQAFWKAYEEELERLIAVTKRGGGDFYRTQGARVSPRFQRAVYVSTWEGRSSFTEAFRLLGIKKTSTFQEMGRRLGLEL